MQNLLLTYLNDSTVSSITVFKKLVAAIRPDDVNEVIEAEQKLMRLQTYLEKDEALRIAFAKRLTTLIGEARQSELFTNVTAVSRSSFFPELRKLAFYKILPPYFDEQDLSDIVHLIFSGNDDYKWFCNINSNVMARFIKAVGIIPSAQLHNENYVVTELLDDLYLLSQVITSLSIDSHIIKNFKELIKIGRAHV